MANHSMRAAAHDKLAEWCDALYNYLKLYEKKKKKKKNRRPPTGTRKGTSKAESAAYERMKEQLEDAIGEADLVTLTPSYHRERALLHYRATLETHSEGRAYKQILDNMYYLDDDFHDELTHFCAAAERFRINSGQIENGIGRLSIHCNSTRVHNPEHYYSWEPGGPQD